MSFPQQQTMRTMYLEQLHARYATVTLPIASTDYAFPLHMLFQPMVLRHDPFAAQKDQSTTSTIVEAKDGREALAKSVSRRIVMLGGPGMGKTTALKALLQQAITAAQEDLTAPLPLFISLPDLARSALSLPEYIRHTIRDMQIDTLFADTLIEAVQNGQAFLCLDSLDEILPTLRPDIIALINHEALRCQGTWIVGSRFTEYQGGQFSHSQFAEWELQPLDQEQRLNLAQQLLPPLHDILHRDQPVNERPSVPSAETFTLQLQYDSQLASWAENPLLFSLAAVSYVQTGQLPATRALLYQQVMETMFKMRIPSAAHRTELRHLLASLALQFYQTHGRNFTVQDILALLPSFVPEQSPEALNALVTDILNTGVLESVTHETYGFKHQMFQEYLSAIALADRLCATDEAQRKSTRDFIWQKRRFSRWNEILTLLVGILVQEHGAEGLHAVSDWLRALIKEKDAPDNDPGNLCLILAVQSLYELGEHRLEPEMLSLAQQVLEQWAGQSIELNRIGGWQIAGRLGNMNDVVLLFPLQIVIPIIELLQQNNPFFHSSYRPLRAPDVVDFGIPVSILSPVFRDMLSTTLYDCHRVQTLQTESVITGLAELLSASPQNLNAEDQKTVLQILGRLGEKASVPLLLDIWQDTTRPMHQRTAAATALSMDDVPTPFEIFVRMQKMSIPEFRVAAVVAICRRNGAASLHLLLPALQDNDARVRVAAVEELYTQKIPVPITLLRDLAFSAYEDISRFVWMWLYEIQAYLSLEEWVAALQHDYPWIRINALEHIAAYDPATLVEALLPLLSLHKKDDYYQDIRLECIQALGILGERVPLQPLQELLHDEDDQVCTQTLKALLQRKALLPPDLLLPLLHRSSISELAAEVLALLGAEAPISTLLEMVYSPSIETAYGAALSLRHLYKYVATDAIMPLLQNEHILNSFYPTYRELIQLLQLQGVELPLEQLAHTLDNNSTDENPSLIAALSLAGSHAPIESLLRKIYSESYSSSSFYYHPQWVEQLFYVLYEWVTPDHLRHALNNAPVDHWLAIRLLDDSESLPYLMEIMQDTTRHKDIRIDAISLLCQRDIAVPLEYLLQATRLSDQGISYVERAVERLGAKAPIEQLLPLLSDHHAGLQLAVANALKNIAQYLPTEPIFSRFEDPDQTVRISAISIAGAMGERAPLDRFLSILHDKTQDKAIREAVIYALGEIGTLVPLHFQLYMLQDEDTDMRTAVLYTLGVRGEPIPLEPLLALLNDPDARIIRTTLHTLVGQIAIGVTIPTEPLISLLDHEDEIIAEDAFSVLCQLGTNAPIDVLLAHLLDKNTGELKDNFFSKLHHLGANAPLEAILNILPPTIDMDRWYIVTTLENFAEIMPERILALLLDDPRPIMRLPVLRAIQVLPDPTYLPSVLESLQSTEGNIHYAAIYALAAFQTRAPIEPLLDLLQAGDEKDLPPILDRLEQFGPQVPLTLLLTLLESHDHLKQERACNILKKLYPTEAAKLAPVAKAILRGEPAQDFFVTHMQYRIAETIAAMGRATPAVLNMAIELLDYPFWEVRVKAIEALGTIRRNIPDQVIRRLIALRNAPERPAIRSAANQALAEILSLEQGMEDD